MNLSSRDKDDVAGAYIIFLVAANCVAGTVDDVENLLGVRVSVQLMA